MYCPKCAAQVDGMKFCRQCGTNVSVVSQALAGRPPEQPEREEPSWHGMDWGAGWGWGGHKRRKRPSIESAANEFFGGLGMLFVALAVWQFFPAGKVWWFWLLIPAFGGIGKGIGQYLRVRGEQQQSFQPPLAPPRVTAAPPEPHFPVPTTSELKLPEQAAQAPQSITEHTTKHLDAARPREADRS